MFAKILTIVLLILPLTMCGYFWDKPDRSNGDQGGETAGGSGGENPCQHSRPLELRRAIYDTKGDEIDDAQAASELVNWQALSVKSADHKKFNFAVLFGTCSGSFIKQVNVKDTSPAYILTNGHCVASPLLPSTGVFYDLPPGIRKATFNYYLDATVAERKVFAAKTIVFASMEATDVGLVALATTYADVIKAGFVAIPMASARPTEAQTPMHLVGMPQSHLKTAQLGLRLSTCCTDRLAVNLHEGDYRFSDSISYRGCSIVGGNSGSPMVDLKKWEVFAVVNTGVNDPASPNECIIDHPCEVSADSKVATHGDRNYGQHVSFLTLCFNADGIFDRNAPGCGIAQKFPQAATLL